MLTRFIRGIDDWLFQKRLFERNLSNYNKLLAGYINKFNKNTVLEIGCGLGNYHSLLSLPRFYAIDIDKSLINHWGKKRNKKSYLVSTINFCCFKKNSFDLVFFKGSFHETEMERVLSTVNNLLKKDGKIVIFDILNKKLYTSRIIKNHPSLALKVSYLKYILTENELGISKGRHLWEFLLFLLIRHIPSYKKEILMGGKFDESDYLTKIKEHFKIKRYKVFGDLFILIEGDKNEKEF